MLKAGHDMSAIRWKEDKYAYGRRRARWLHVGIAGFYRPERTSGGMVQLLIGSV